MTEKEYNAVYDKLLALGKLLGKIRNARQLKALLEKTKRELGNEFSHEVFETAEHTTGDSPYIRCLLNIALREVGQKLLSPENAKEVRKTLRRFRRELEKLRYSRKAPSAWVALHSTPHMTKRYSALLANFRVTWQNKFPEKSMEFGEIEQ